MSDEKTISDRLVPAADRFPPASAVTPSQILAAAARVAELRAARAESKEIAEAERAHDDLCSQQNQQMQQIVLQRQISALLR